MSTTGSLERLQQLLPELFNPKQLPGSLYLRFKLDPHSTALLSMDQVQESLLVPAEQITPLPNMPSSVLGLLNSRGTVFCVIDLPHVMQLSTSQINPQQYQVIVARMPDSLQTSDHESLLGLAVPQILGVYRLVTEDFQLSVQALPAHLQPFAYGSAFEGEHPMAVLDIAAIATAPGLLSL
jgi:positive phototaxis protein PixI